MTGGSLAGHLVFVSMTGCDLGASQPLWCLAASGARFHISRFDRLVSCFCRDKEDERQYLMGGDRWGAKSGVCRVLQGWCRSFGPVQSRHESSRG